MGENKRKFPPLEGENSWKFCEMWTLKHETSSGSHKCYVGFQKFMYEPIEIFDFVYPQGCY